jgi:hypothetical protein
MLRELNVTVQRCRVVLMVLDGVPVTEVAGYGHAGGLLRCNDYPDRRLAAVPRLP